MKTNGISRHLGSFIVIAVMLITIAHWQTLQMPPDSPLLDPSLHGRPRP